MYSASDYSLFLKKDRTCNVFVVVYVDDIIMTGTDLAKIQFLKAYLHDHFKIRDLGKLHYFLGLEILYRKKEY